MSGDLGAILGPIVIGMIAETYDYTIAFSVTAMVLVLAVIAWWLARETWGKQQDGGSR